MKDAVIIADNLSMNFKIYNQRITSFKEYFIKKMKNDLRSTYFQALKDISFEVYRGDVFGILGLNGAGKSTLLKIVSGILKPTSGNIKINGSIAPLIELGAGFDPELTARENIYLNGAVLGYSNKFMNEKFNEILEFSELQDFVDTPIKNFSSGMYARLGFSISTAVVPDILILDEILSVGDFKFQEKCQEKIKNMIEKGTTVIFVSHSIDQIRMLCNRSLILEKGENIYQGNTSDVCDFYKDRY